MYASKELKWKEVVESYIAKVHLDIIGTATHIKEIPNTKLLVSIQHLPFKSGHMEIYDVSKKTVKTIYSLGEVSGGK